MISKTIGCRGLAYFQTNPCMKKHIAEVSDRSAAEKYFRKRLRRQQRNMPALPAIVISDDSDDDVEVLN